MSELELWRSDAITGCCLVCDEPIRPRERICRGRKRQLCGSLDCWRAYQAIWARDARAAERARGRSTA